MKLNSMFARIAVLLGSIVWTVAAAGQDVGLESTWLAEDIKNGGVIDDLQTTLTIGPDNQASGNGGCNGFGGAYTLEGDKLTFGDLASTMMACAPAIMDQERKFFDALAEVRTWRLNDGTGILYLGNDQGADILRFSRTD